MDKVAWWRTSLGQEELQKLSESFALEHISQGPVTAEFEEQFAQALEVPYAIATTNGSSALMMSLMALDVRPGDEVIVPNRTFIAAAHAVLMLGAKVVLVDVLPDIPTMDVAQVRRKITSKTKAVLPVHVNGHAVDIKALRQICGESGIHILEDACQAMFSKNGHGFLGTQSDIGCFSFAMTKLITTGQGGMAVTRSQELYERMKLIRNQGVPDVHSATYARMGFNFKFTDMQASLGLVQLSRVPQRIDHVNDIYQKYASIAAELPFLKLIPVDVSGGEVGVWVEALIEDRDRLVDFLESQRIQTRPFPPDLHLSPHLDCPGDFPNSAKFGEKGIFLPCGPEQTFEHIDLTIEALKVYAGLY